MSRLLTPDQLEADATVPQCADNQFVSNETFAIMTDRGIDYGYSDIDARRKTEARLEFHRSLVYSSQVVLNRAFLVNSPTVYRNYLPEDTTGTAAFAELLTRPSDPDRAQAIVPYLHEAAALTDPFPFEEDLVGRKALNHLMSVLDGEVSTVRLAADDRSNQARVDALNSALAEYLSGRLRSLLRPTNIGHFNEMASELMGPRSHVLQEPGALEDLGTALGAVSRYAFDHGGSRTALYKEFLVAGDTPEEKKDNVVLGRFQKPGPDHPFLFEAKKLIDLVYNTNLPDALNRYTFTPVGMPSRMALQDFSAARTLPAEVDIENVLQRAANLQSDLNRMFMANVQRAMLMPLPRMDELSLPDIVEVRQLPAWEGFSRAQQAVLQEPLGVIDRLEHFSRAFDDFQLALSNWYFQRYELRQTAERFANFATIALQIAGRTMISLALPGEQAANILVGHIAGAALESLIPRRVKGMMINLMVYVIDVERKVIDPRRSYSVELMRTEIEYTQAEVLDLIRQFVPASSTLEVANSLIEDQDASDLSAQGTP